MSCGDLAAVETLRACDKGRGNPQVRRAAGLRCDKPSGEVMLAGVWPSREASL